LCFTRIIVHTHFLLFSLSLSFSIYVLCLSSIVYNWHDVAARTEVVYAAALARPSPTTLQRFFKALRISGGGVSGGNGGVGGVGGVGGGVSDGTGGGGGGGSGGVSDGGGSSLFGLYCCALLVTNHLLWCFLCWCQPDEEIERANTLSGADFRKRLTRAKQSSRNGD
jgi:hypothetical protein